MEHCKHSATLHGSQAADVALANSPVVHFKQVFVPVKM